jgi:hypothetical protein
VGKQQTFFKLFSRRGSLAQVLPQGASLPQAENTGKHAKVIYLFIRHGGRT